MHSAALGRTRAERVKQVVEREASIWDFAAYVPISSATAKLHTWAKHGAEISYLSSHRNVEDVQKDLSVLRKYGFPDGEVYYRTRDEGYSEIVERMKPDVLVEDDCESIGGREEMVFPQLKPEVRSNIKSMVVKEFEGIDHLPDDILGIVNS